MCTNNGIEIQSQGYKYLKAESILSCKILFFQRQLNMWCAYVRNLGRLLHFVHPLIISGKDSIPRNT